MTPLLLALLLQDDWETTIRALEKDIAETRGLAFKEPVKAKRIARGADAPKKVQGFYSLRDKTLYLYDDIQGAYERGVLIHEMVHALQDQHFGLAKLHETAGTDEELAASALIEGDATWTMIRLVPRAAAMLDVPLEKSKDKRSAFLYAEGARYVRALHEKGGWDAVNRAYRMPPRSTAAILHPEGVKTVDLGPGTTVGELAILEKVGASAAAGWRGDRKSGGTWTLAFATSKDALEFQAAWAKTVTGLAPFLDEPGASAWRGAHRVVAVLAKGDRAYVLEAKSDAELAQLLDRLEGLRFEIWSVKDRRLVGFGEMVDRLLEAEIVCVGETHDSEIHHAIQLRIVKALYASDESLGVGMEMFQRPFQDAIDRYFAGRSTEEEFLKATEYRERWGFDWKLYRPIVEFCRRNGIPLAALNAPKELTARISKVGIEGLTDDERRALGDVDLDVPEHRAWWFERLGKMHGNRTPTKEQQERSYQVMTTWDEYMGASAARFQQARGIRRMVVLAGSGHVDRGFGIPARAAKRTGGRAATVHIAVGGDVRALAADPPADFIVVVR